MATKKEIIEKREREREGVKLWRAQCDEVEVSHSEYGKFEYEWANSTLFVTGTCYSGRRVTVQIGWDANGPYAWNGNKYRWYEDGRRAQGILVLDPRR